MKNGLIIRTVKTASGATAVQVIRYENKKRIIVRHIGSAHTDDELAALRNEAELVREQLSPQLSLLPLAKSHTRLVHMDHLQLQSVTHCFAHQALKQYIKQCELHFLHALYQDLAFMRIIEPASKLRSITLLRRYFHITYLAIHI